MKRRITELQRKVAPLQKQVLRGVPTPASEAGRKGLRFTAKGLRSQRQRLGLSAADYGKLVGVTGQTIYSWEHENARPRQQQVARIAVLRGLGKREAGGARDIDRHGRGLYAKIDCLGGMNIRADQPECYSARDY